MEDGRRRRGPRAFRTLARRAAPIVVIGALAFGVLGLAGFVEGNPWLASNVAQTAATVASAEAAAATAPPATSAPTNRIDEAPDGVVSALVSPGGDGQLAPGGDLLITVSIVNKTDTELPAGELVVYLDPGNIDSRSEYGAWLAGTGDGPAAELGVELLRAGAPSVRAGATASVEVVAPAAAIPLGDTATFGPRGIAVRHMIGGAEVTQGRSTIVFASALDAQSTPVSVVVPIAPPEGTAGLVPAEQLAELTAPGGRLSDMLDAVAGTSATLAIDPRLLVSIRALGDEAPASAAQWLARLATLPNDSFALPYADADLTLQRQAGLAEPLELLDASFALGPEVAQPGVPGQPDGTATSPPATDETPDATGSASPDGTAGADGAATPADPPTSAPAPSGDTGTPAPTGTPGPDDPPARPTLAELTAFPYTLEGVAWPADGTLSAGDLAVFGPWGYRAIVVDEGSVERLDDFAFTPAADVDLDGWSALAADSQLSGGFALAASAQSPVDRDAAIAQIATVLAIVARELPFEPRQLLATVGHAGVASPDDLGHALRAVDAMAWAAPGTFTLPDLTTGDVPQAALREGAHDPAVIERFDELLAAEARAGQYSTMFDDPSYFRSQQRAALLATVSAAWHHDVAAWIPASQAYLDNVTATEASVVVTESSDIQLVGRETELPIFVRNDTDRAVTVQVVLEPTTGRIEAGGPVTLRIEPGSMARAQVPVQAISNGTAVVDVRILTPDGVPLLSTRSISVNVQAEWETVTIVVAVVGLTTLFVWGIVRTVRRRRRERVDASFDQTGDEALTGDRK